MCYTKIKLRGQSSSGKYLRKAKEKMMTYITGKRSSGKTTKLIYVSALTGYPIITPTKSNAEFIKKQAGILGVKIPEPISATTLKMLSRGWIDINDKFLIDDADSIIEQALKEYLHCTPVAAVINNTIKINTTPKE